MAHPSCSAHSRPGRREDLVAGPKVAPKMHPIERLRYVARASDDRFTLLVRESAAALASFSDDPAALVTACRRLVDRQPHSAAIWWLAARVLASSDPDSEAWDASSDIDSDATVSNLIDLIPADASVLVLGWPESIVPALTKRGDVRVFAVDTFDDGARLVTRLERSGSEAILVDERGVGAAASEASLVLLEAQGLGSTGITAVPGSRAAAAVARLAGVPVWATAGVGRVLPGRLWDAYARRLDDEADPWDNDFELVPLNHLDAIVGPAGLATPAEAAKRADCPITPELFKSLG